MANWFECKVRYDKIMENGAVKKVNEPYLVDALSFTEAEARIIEEMTPFISGEFNISAVKRTKISEIFWDDSADKWYLVKVAFITIDEKTAVEKKTTTLILTAASNFKNALDNFLEGMKGTMADFEIVSISETPLMDVYKANLGGDAPIRRLLHVAGRDAHAGAAVSGPVVADLLDLLPGGGLGEQGVVNCR